MKDKLMTKIQALGRIRNNSELLIVTEEECEVCNEKGSSKRSPYCPNCGPWKEHWIKLTGKNWPLFCSNSECFKQATVGGHVVFANDKSGRRFIVPLCSNCNGKSSEERYTISGGTVLISANCSETCDTIK